jgi:hypothetical protein
MKAFLQSLAPQIRRLLHPDHEPIVTKRISSIYDAGLGVYTTRFVIEGEVCVVFPCSLHRPYDN